MAARKRRLHRLVSNAWQRLQPPPSFDKEMKQLEDLTTAHKQLVAVVDRFEQERKQLAAQLDKKLYVATHTVSLSELSRGGIWLYSLNKSGTTLLINLFVNYLNIMFRGGSTPLSMRTAGLFHSTHELIKKYTPGALLLGQRHLMSDTSYSCFVHTHRLIPEFAEKVIVLSRNPLDFVTSYYHYIFHNRGDERPLVDVWQPIVDQFVRIVTNQNEMASKREVLKLRYETLVSRVPETLEEVLSFLALPLEKGALSKAVEFASVDNVRSQEKARGRPIIAGKGYTAESFIRSGRVGDWRNHIDENLAERILDKVARGGIDSDAFQYDEDAMQDDNDPGSASIPASK